MPPCSPPSDPFNLFSITGLCWFSFFFILRPLTSHRRCFPRLLSLIPRLWCLVHLCVLHLFSSRVCLIWPRLFRSDLCLTSDISLLFPSSSVDLPPSLPLSSSLYRLVFFSPLLPSPSPPPPQVQQQINKWCPGNRQLLQHRYHTPFFPSLHIPPSFPFCEHPPPFPPPPKKTLSLASPGKKRRGKDGNRSPFGSK